MRGRLSGMAAALLWWRSQCRAVRTRPPVRQARSEKARPGATSLPAGVERGDLQWMCEELTKRSGGVSTRCFTAARSSPRSSRSWMP